MARLLSLILACMPLINAIDWSVCPIFNGTCQVTCSPRNRGPTVFPGTQYLTCPRPMICCLNKATDTCQNHELCGTIGVPTSRGGFPDRAERLGFAPWQISLRRSESENQVLSLVNTIHVGAGVLIHPEWIITDCTQIINVGKKTSSETIEKRLLIVFGDNDISKPEVYNSRSLEQIRTADKIVYQSGYRYSFGQSFVQLITEARLNFPEYYQANSICMIKLSAPIDITATVRPICLPEPGVCTDNINCRVTGWGLNENSALDKLLQVTYLSQFSKPACEAIEFYRTGNSTTLPSNIKCAQNLRSSFSCGGDFGGPLACDDVNNGYRSTLQGIMTYTLPCRTDVMRISNVPAVVDWVWDTCSNN